MGRAMGFCFCAVLSLVLFLPFSAHAEGELKEMHQDIKDNAQAAHAEEARMRGDIRDALAAGDKEKAMELKEELRSTHRENMQAMQEDMERLHESRKELMRDKKAAKKDMIDRNDDGVIDDAERGAWKRRKRKALKRRRDNDNNPPGPRGGPGTNWENPPGPKGGPGASPGKRGGGRRK